MLNRQKNESRMSILDIDELETFSFLFRGKAGNKLAEKILHWLSIDKINQVYLNSLKYKGAEFTEHLLKDLGACYAIGNPGNLEKLPKGAFITIANHPFGGLDGIMLIDLFASFRTDYKLMVNKLLSRVKTLYDNFIQVIPTGNEINQLTKTNIRAIRETLNHLRNGHPAGFFPSGAVSDLSLKDHSIRDRQWQEGILHLIRSAEVPVLPVRFFDLNSAFFYFLGLINWRIRLLRLPTELFNKGEKILRVGIGKLISVEEQLMFPDPESFGTYLRNAVYKMPEPDIFIPRNEL